MRSHSPPSQKQTLTPRLDIQNKDKQKKGALPQDIVDHHYHAARTVGDEWICYPWEALDIEEHDRNAAAALAK